MQAGICRHCCKWSNFMGPGVQPHQHLMVFTCQSSLAARRSGKYCTNKDSAYFSCLHCCPRQAAFLGISGSQDGTKKGCAVQCRHAAHTIETRVVAQLQPTQLRKHSRVVTPGQRQTPCMQYASVQGSHIAFAAEKAYAANHGDSTAWETYAVIASRHSVCRWPCLTGCSCPD